MLALAILTAVVVAVVGLLVGEGRPQTVPVGLPDAGALTGWALRVASPLLHMTSALTVGCLLVGTVLLPSGTRDSDFDALARRAMTSAGVWAAAWSGLTMGVLVLNASDTAGVPLEQMSPDLVLRMGETSQGAALVVVVVLTAVVAWSSRRAGAHPGNRMLPLVLAIAALVPTAVTGHASSGADHDVATSALVVHVIAAAIWVGGLGALLLQLRGSPRGLAAAVPRFSVLAFSAYAALAMSGLLTAGTRLDASWDAWTSPYGLLLITKVLALLALGLLGHLHRRRTLPLLGSGNRRPFLRLAAVELVVMSAAMGLAAALARTPTPPTLATVEPAHGLGHPTLPSVVAPVSLGELVTQWRLNALVVVVLVLAFAAYTAGVRSLARRGECWPVGRTLAFAAGLLVALVDLCSGVATYAPALVSVQIAQLLVALLVVPVLLVLGAPLTLWLRVRRHDQSVLQSRWLRTLSTPFVGAGITSALLLGLYRTPLIELSLSSFWVHLLVLALAMVSGFVLLWPLLAVDPVPAATSPTDAWPSLAAVGGCLVLLAAQLRYSDRLLAADWFLDLRWGWVDPVADQRLGGSILATTAVAALLLVGAVSLKRRESGPRG